MSNTAPFRLAVPESDLIDLRRRLSATRWPDPETVDDWSQGVPLARMRDLVAYWRHDYDWRRCESMLNDYGLAETTIDDVAIRFLHVRSAHEGALPLLMTHGWPGSIVEFHKVVRPLTDPVAFGGHASDAFHLVVPCLPGYGLSERPREVGWTVDRTAEAWHVLMQRLGYQEYVAHGEDKGSLVSISLGRMAPEGLRAIHLTQLILIPLGDMPAETKSADHEAAVQQFRRYLEQESGYSVQQRTRPQTLGYGLADSPVSQAAWVYEKLAAWSDCNGDPESIFTKDEILDNIMLYWLSNTGTSAARSYWEGRAADYTPSHLYLPVGCSIFPKEILLAPRSLAEHYYHDIFYWNELPKGGHFAAFEQPEIFVCEMRNCFASMR